MSLPILIMQWCGAIFLLFITVAFVVGYFLSLVNRAKRIITQDDVKKIHDALSLAQTAIDDVATMHAAIDEIEKQLEVCGEKRINLIEGELRSHLNLHGKRDIGVGVEVVTPDNLKNVVDSYQSEVRRIEKRIAEFEGDMRELKSEKSEWKACNK